jgi:hypothetical protein
MGAMILRIEKKLFSNDIESEAKLMGQIHQVKERNITVSYQGNSLSLNVNLPSINVCSVNLKTTVPFVCLPKSASVFPSSLIYYINVNLTTMLDRMPGRTCR